MSARGGESRVRARERRIPALSGSERRSSCLSTSGDSASGGEGASFETLVDELLVPLYGRTHVKSAPSSLRRNHLSFGPF